MRNPQKHIFPLFFLWLLLILQLPTGGALQAQQSLIEVTASVDKSVITVGDLINYTLTIDRKKTLNIREPQPGEKIGAFEIKEYQKLPPKEQGERIVEQFEFTITTYDTGTYMIPPYPVGYLPSDTSTNYEIITAEPLEITVESVLESGDAELQDIRPPMGFPGPNWLAWTLGGVLLLLIAGAIYLWLRKKKSGGKPIFRKEVIRPAHEIAQEELQQLLDSDLLSRGKYKHFYSILSDILRRYIEGRFFIRALEETTSELHQSLINVDVPESQAALALRVLSDCDMVKFAKHIPQKTETAETVRLVREFIELTHIEFERVENIEKVETEVTQATSEQTE